MCDKEWWGGAVQDRRSVGWRPSGVPVATGMGESG